MKKNKNKLNQKRRQRKAAKENKREKAKKWEKAIQRTITHYNRVRYRPLPGMPGLYPYQLTPIGRNEAIQILRTGHFTRGSSMMNVSHVTKGGETKMTDEQKKRLADLQALETLAEEEKPVLAALETLATADKALADVKAATPVDPVAVAQKAYDEALKAYTDAEAAFQATQNAGGSSQPQA